MRFRDLFALVIWLLLFPCGYSAFGALFPRVSSPRASLFSPPPLFISIPLGACEGCETGARMAAAYKAFSACFE